MVQKICFGLFVDKGAIIQIGAGDFILLGIIIVAENLRLVVALFGQDMHLPHQIAGIENFSIDEQVERHTLVFRPPFRGDHLGALLGHATQEPVDEF